MSDERPHYGWQSDFPAFRDAKPLVIRERLAGFVRDASPEQMRAWGDAIPPLQHGVEEVLSRDSFASRYSAILEYELPLETRRPDVILLVRNRVLVLELKGKSEPSQADLDQASAYARDLRCYHRECWTRPVTAVLVPTRAKGYLGHERGVHIAGPDAIDALVAEFATGDDADVPDRSRFLDPAAYQPLPTLVQAARELLATGELRRVTRAHAATEPAVKTLSEVIHLASATKTRHLVLLTGVPGAGKTLVGLRVVHEHYLDDLSVPRLHGKPTAPAVFLSGNGPLVEVLQHELKAAGGGGKTFIRGVKDYVQTYSRRPGLVPPEHVLVFDEAQRAFDAEAVAAKHEGLSGQAKSEPEHFVEFSERVPEWCVVLALLGTGQEIHIGEEGGVIEWRRAVEGATHEWIVHVPPALADEFASTRVAVEVRENLSLDISLRQHLASELHKVVADVLSLAPIEALREQVRRVEEHGFHFRLTRSLEQAKDYLWERYREVSEARFGLIASSRDRDLESFGVPNEFQAVKNIRVGLWYSEPENSSSGRSCRRLEACATEFYTQGLELDATLLAWGTDLALHRGQWSIERARKYRKPVRDPKQLRLNAYRVLLTRAREACVIFVPPLAELDETFEYLSSLGFVAPQRANDPSPETPGVP